MVKNVGKVMAVLALVLGLSVLGLCQTNGPKTLTILHTNDTHSAMLPFDHPAYHGPFGWLKSLHGAGWRPDSKAAGGVAPVRESGGIARMSTLIKSVRAKNKLVRVPMPGWLILGGLEYSTAYVEYTKDLCIQASGLTYAYDSSLPPGCECQVLFPPLR